MNPRPRTAESRNGLPRLYLTLGLLAGPVLAYEAAAVIGRILRSCGGEAGAGLESWAWLFGLFVVNVTLAVVAWAVASARPAAGGATLVAVFALMLVIAWLAVFHAIGAGTSYATSVDATASCPGKLPWWIGFVNPG